MEWYRNDLEEHQKRDPFPILKSQLMENGIEQSQLDQIEKIASKKVNQDFEEAVEEESPSDDSLTEHVFAPTEVLEEKGERSPEGKEPTVMVDSALFAIRELMESDDRCLLYGQDVGGRLGGYLEKQLR